MNLPIGFPFLSNGRILLDQMDISQAKAYSEILSEEVTYHYITESGPIQEEEAVQKILANRKSFEEGRSIYWSITESGSQFLGFIAAHNFHEDVVSISFAIHQLHRRKGIASLSLKMIMEWLKSKSKDVQLAVHVENEPSFRMLNKLKLNYCGIQETHFGNRHIFTKSHHL